MNARAHTVTHVYVGEVGEVLHAWHDGGRMSIRIVSGDCDVWLTGTPEAIHHMAMDIRAALVDVVATSSPATSAPSVSSPEADGVAGEQQQQGGCAAEPAVGGGPAAGVFSGEAATLAVSSPAGVDTARLPGTHSMFTAAPI